MPILLGLVTPLVGIPVWLASLRSPMHGGLLIGWVALERGGASEVR